MNALRALCLATFAVVAFSANAFAQDHEPLHGEEEAHASEHEVVEAAEGEHLSHHEEHGISGLELAASIVNFFVLLGIVIYLAKKPTKSFLMTRRAEVVEGLEEAKRLKEAAEAKYAEYQKRLANLDNELAELRAEIVKSGEAERDRIVAEAEHKAARLRKDAQFLIEQQLKQLRIDLTREAVEASIAAAQAVLTQNTSATDQERVARDYLQKLATAKTEVSQ